MRELSLREVGSSQEDKEGGRDDRTRQNRQNLNAKTQKTDSNESCQIKSKYKN